MSPLQYLSFKTGVLDANISKWKRMFCQGGGKGSEEWPDEKDSTNGGFQKEEVQLYRRFQHRRQKKMKVSTLWVSVTFHRRKLSRALVDEPTREPGSATYLIEEIPFRRTRLWRNVSCLSNQGVWQGRW